MRKFTVFVLSPILIIFICISCQSENNQKSKLDESSAEYQLALIMCDCFDNNKDSDLESDFNVIDCFMENVKDDDLKEADEFKTKQIMKEICPKSFENFGKWNQKIEAK
jgi:hypothetical protein